MYAHTHIYIYIHIYFTACGPLKHQHVISGRRNQVFWMSKRSLHKYMRWEGGGGNDDYLFMHEIIRLLL